jgi:hypothetical protein
MGAASKKEIRSAMRQGSHRATRFRLHLEQTRWQKVYEVTACRAKPTAAESLDCNPSLGYRAQRCSWRRCWYWLLLRCGPTGRRCYRLPCRSPQDSCCPSSPLHKTGDEITTEVRNFACQISWHNEQFWVLLDEIQLYRLRKFMADPVPDKGSIVTVDEAVHRHISTEVCRARLLT